jgi:heme-degrading monooxygenase HmoA
MSEVYSSATWKVKDGEDDAFVEAWKEFAGWGMGMPGAGTARLVKDLDNPGQYLSFAPWESLDQMHAWKSDPGFRERMGKVQAHVADFNPSELELAAEV